jgi:hypothetical protein
MWIRIQQHLSTFERGYKNLRWAPGLFSRFRANECELKKRESVKKNQRENSESRERERKKAREFAVFPLFAAKHWKPGS